MQRRAKIASHPLCMIPPKRFELKKPHHRCGNPRCHHIAIIPEVIAAALTVPLVIKPRFSNTAPSTLSTWHPSHPIKATIPASWKSCSDKKAKIAIIVEPTKAAIWPLGEKPPLSPGSHFFIVDKGLLVSNIVITVHISSLLMYYGLLAIQPPQYCITTARFYNLV